ncbi:MAG TPA: non-heme iron oxygenase ferredoxin subunit [Stellaceae bacterium]|nr:non-heme iron oxygenase ferredoxin subunit [Stellaceae bacterium]
MTTRDDGFVAVAQIDDIPDGAMKCVAINRERVLLARVGGEFYALRDTCGHRNAPLSRGRLSGYGVECPLHFARFDVRTGKLIDGPISADVPTYEVRIEAECVLVRH